MSARSVSTLRVRYAETDQMGVAWHGSYLAWFEVGRTDLLRERGLTYRQLEAQGLRLPVIEARARFRKPALYDDLIEVHTRLDALGRARVRFLYEVERAGELLADGSTEHAAVDPLGRPRRLPDELRRRLAATPGTGVGASRPGGVGGIARAIAAFSPPARVDPAEMTLAATPGTGVGASRPGKSRVDPPETKVTP